MLRRKRRLRDRRSERLRLRQAVIWVAVVAVAVCSTRFERRPRYEKQSSA